MTTLLKYRIIELLSDDLDSLYSISDIAKKLGVAYSHAHLFIKKLDDEGVIKIKKVGNTSVCILNPSNLTLAYLSQLSYQKTQKFSHPHLERLYEKINLVKDHIHSIIICGNKLIIIAPEKIGGVDFSIFKNRTVINQFQFLANKNYYKNCHIIHGAEKYWSFMLN